MPVNPGPGISSIITAGGSAEIAINPSPNGGYITNPVTAADQGIAAAEVLYVDPVTSPGLAANGTTVALQPGQTWNVIPGQTTPTRVNAQNTGHRFTVVVW